MKKIILIILLIGIKVAVNAQDAKPSDVNQQFFKAMLAEDYESLQNIFHDEYVFIFIGGNYYDGDIMVQGIKNSYARFDICETIKKDQVTSLGNMSIVSGLWKLKGRIRDSDIDETMVYSNTFVKEDKIWKLVRTQITQVSK